MATKIKMRRDYSGRRFGALLVTSPAHDDMITGKARWTCQCDCGNVIEVEAKRIGDSGPQSCGCSFRDGTPMTIIAMLTVGAKARDALEGEGVTTSRDALAKAIESLGGVPKTQEGQSALIRMMQEEGRI